jgi:hemoglobin
VSNKLVLTQIKESRRSSSLSAKRRAEHGMSGIDGAVRQISPYDMMGGEEAVRRLADRFYDVMLNDPAMAQLRALHAEDVAPMRRRLFEFLSGWLGGPRLYNRCVMSAHAQLAISARERDAWLACMDRALTDAGVTEQVRNLVMPAFTRMCDAMLAR